MGYISEKEINKNYSILLPKTTNLKHIKASEMKFVKIGLGYESACGKFLVDSHDLGKGQIKETNNNLYLKNLLSRHCLKCLVAINVLEFAGNDRYWFLKTVIVGTGKEQQTFRQGEKW